MEITFSIDDTKVTKKLSLMKNGFSDCRKPLSAAGEKLLSLYGIEVFETQGGAIGDSWRSLAASTQNSRAKRTGYYRNPPIRTDKILVWTGRLQSGMKKEVTKDMLRIYNSVPYFRHHQTRGGRTPQRKMLAITSRVITTVVDEISKYAQDITEQTV